MFRILKWVFGITLLASLVGLAVIYNKEIIQYSETWQTQKEGAKAQALGDWTQAIKIYEEGLKTHPNNVEFALTLASLYRQQGGAENQAKSEELYEKLIQIDSTSLEPRIGYASLLMGWEGRMNEALVQSREALKHHSNNPKLLNTLGNLYKQAAERPCENRQKLKRWFYDWAIYFYRMALKQDPNLYETHFNLGVAYHQTDHMSKAAMAYCNAMLLAPEHYEAHYNLGLVLVSLHEVEEGYRHLNQAIQMLRDEGRDKDAELLAEQIQAFKSSIFEASEYSSLHNPSQNQAYPIDQRCLVPQTPEKKSS